MENVGLILLVFAFGCSIIAAFILLTTPRVHFGWMAVMFWIASQLLGGLGRIFH